MQNVSNFVGSTPSVSISVNTPSAGYMTKPGSMAPTMALNNGCYPAAYYINSYAMPAINKLNQAALETKMKNINKANEEANLPGATTNFKDEGNQPQEINQTTRTNQENQTVTVQTNPIKQEVEVPKELVDAIKQIAKNTSSNKPKMELTDHYVRNLESYLNAQDTKLRLMAGQDVVARLQEDPERKDNPALTALTNKMLQDPELGVRSLSLAALEANLITGDDFTNQLLKQMSKQKQGSQEADVANKILLRMPQ